MNYAFAKVLESTFKKSVGTIAREVANFFDKMCLIIEACLVSEISERFVSVEGIDRVFKTYNGGKFFGACTNNLPESFFEYTLAHVKFGKQITYPDIPSAFVDHGNR